MSDIITPNREIVKPHHPEDRDRELYVVLGIDTFAIIRNLVKTTTGEPKAAVIKSCYGLKVREKDVEYAEMPRNSGEYPMLSIRAKVNSREFTNAGVFAVTNKARLTVDPVKMYITLGFTERVSKEGE